MIDGFKAQIERFDESALLWKGSYYEETGEIIPGKRSASHLGLTFFEKNGYCFCKGSLHKFYNQGDHNCGDFSPSNVLEAIEGLAAFLKTEPKYLTLKNIEFGITCNMLNPVANYQDAMLIHGTNMFKSAPCDKIPRGIEKFAEYQRYRIKSYDKSNQFRSEGNWLRTETKASRMAYFSQHGIHLCNLEDLKTPHLLGQLANLHFNNISKIIMIDPYNPERFSRDELDTLHTFSNPRAYNSIVPSRAPLLNTEQVSQYKKNRKKYYSNLEKLKQIINKHGLNSLQNELIGELHNKINTFYS